MPRWKKNYGWKKATVAHLQIVKGEGNIHSMLQSTTKEESNKERGRQCNTYTYNSYLWKGRGNGARESSERQHHTGKLKSLRTLKGCKSLAPKKKEWPLVFVTQGLREGN